jgi:ABC-type uncharacterized transport system fused permease/ATPase subunit
MGISFVSVGHRDSLKEFHDHLIVLDKTGGFKISDLPITAPPHPDRLPPSP